MIQMTQYSSSGCLARVKSIISIRILDTFGCIIGIYCNTDICLFGTELLQSIEFFCPNSDSFSIL